MDEKESLKRQIELLQNLINRHKSIHGNAPCPGVEQRDSEVPASSRGRDQSSSIIHAHSSRGNPYVLHSRGSWRKTYSLNNKKPQPTASTSNPYPQWSSRGGSNSASLPSHSQKYVDDRTLPSRVPQPKKEGHVRITKVKEAAKTATKTCKEAAEFQSRDVAAAASSAAKRDEGIQPVLLQKKSPDSTARPSSVKTNSLHCSPQVQAKSSLMRKTSPETKQTVSTATPANITAGIKPPPQASQQFPKSEISQVPVSASFSKKQSKFTWVKNQNVGGGEPRRASSVFQGTREGPSASPVTASKARVAVPSPLLVPVSKKTPAKKLPRKLSLVGTAPKTSKYTWVSSSSGTQARISRKSPKSFAVAQRAVEKGEAVKKLRSGSPYAAKLKRGAASSPTGASISSRYRWKAGAPGTSAAAAATVARRRSAFHWTSDRSLRGAKGGLGVSPTLPQRASFPSSSLGGFKLRSRMKIIRKSASSGCGSEKSSSPAAAAAALAGSKLSPRGRTHAVTKTPTGARKMPSRELVSFGRHKLRRLSPGFARTSPAVLTHRSPASQRVFRTRYKMVTRPGSGTVSALHYNPALLWRTKRIHSARTFLQSRLRAPHHRHPSSTQHWRGTNMCWIGDSLYRVSANKLSRTTATSMSINRTGRWSGPSPSSPTLSPLSRTFSPRHMASRAVQRSIAIIRHAHQKKQPRQYCMYYNRFGKCNRGNSCPYIHDPDKVAVCTRFLRGTCKQAAGTCPFSHKVAKEKMPVCSYFLKGICNNSDCPYSHVYVSRKAEVCQDFVKGYCPEGEKCKKKHTLVCPDFSKNGSCPRGSRCKLQHHQRAKRPAAGAASAAAKRTRVKEPAKRPRLHVVIPQVDDSEADPGTPAAHPLKLPSFISLSSSPEEAETPDGKSPETSQVKEKKLQIKPRL